MTHAVPPCVALLAVPGCQLLDVAGPFELFASAVRAGSPAPAYRVVLVAPEARRVTTEAGLGLEAHETLASLDPASVDTLIVAGGPGSRLTPVTGDLRDWVVATAAACRRVATVCTGAFLLARTGLLDGRTVTTHWQHAETLADRHPALRVEPDRIYVEDGKFWSSAGVTAGMDLALAMIARDLGREEALRIARSKVMAMQRSGGQRQYSSELALQSAADDRLASLQAWMFDHLDDRLSVEDLAARAGMSPRTFARRFREAVGETPAAFVERARLDAARRRLERPGTAVEQVALQTGFVNAERMRRSFQRAFGVSPAEYRRQFGSPASA
ncbi:GlxA family transcriptional regulator [Thalassobaculum litoreum]|uniref:Transcriptional regulator, AraC family with amidase-like domain n=1 Tax=Thalassobaculum litoreum DSM 18839 TaxID=1123362 RepID=A0A8G2BGD0_9PROT|nr:helix-turn-helix domain-containing protein [Thalassobaculum litoreum]SDF41092.1 transcriptional regulator, AraC family with amidase-like domain [Thalassobaculum litoreum DSM 18839]